MPRYRVWDIVWDKDPPEEIPEVTLDFTGDFSSTALAYAVQAQVGFLPIMAEYELLEDA